MRVCGGLSRQKRNVGSNSNNIKPPNVIKYIKTIEKILILTLQQWQKWNTTLIADIVWGEICSIHGFKWKLHVKFLHHLMLLQNTHSLNWSTLRPNWLNFNTSQQQLGCVFFMSLFAFFQCYFFIFQNSRKYKHKDVVQSTYKTNDSTIITWSLENNSKEVRIAAIYSVTCTSGKHFVMEITMNTYNRRHKQCKMYKLCRQLCSERTQQYWTATV